MRISNSHYFNNYKLHHKLLLLIFSCFLIACYSQNAAKQVLPIENNLSSISPLININTASVSDLEKLPHIGRQTAQEIVEYRKRFGKFRKPEHLILIHGISDKKFREIKKMIVAE